MRQAAEPEPDGCPACPEDAHLLADEERGRNPERQRREQIGDRGFGERHAGIGEAKIGMIAKLTHGWSMCSRCRSGLSSASPVGISNATATPASVAWMPDFRTQTQIATPIRR